MSTKPQKTAEKNAAANKNVNAAKGMAEFVRTTSQKDLGHGLFEKETDRLLEVNLNGRVNTKMGSMVRQIPGRQYAPVIVITTENRAHLDGETCRIPPRKSCSPPPACSPRAFG